MTTTYATRSDDYEKFDELFAEAVGVDADCAEVCCFASKGVEEAHCWRICRAR